MAARRLETLRLYKQLLTEAKKFPSYIYRTYALRKIQDSFREHRNETDSEKITDLLSYGKENLEIMKRQVLIGHLYRTAETVIEHQQKETEKTLQSG